MQSQVCLNYVERSRNSLSKNSFAFIAHVILEKLSRNVPKGTKKSQQEIACVIYSLISFICLWLSGSFPVSFLSTFRCVLCSFVKSNMW